jgi:hypothetical protein
VLGLAALGAALAACEPPTDPIAAPEPRLVIHAVLDAGAGFQQVKVEYLDSSIGHELVGAQAEVSIETPDGEVILAMDPDQLPPGAPARGLYLVPLASLVPGGTYTLRVETPSGDLAIGTTTVPAYQAIPNIDFVTRLNRSQDTVFMSWSPMQGAARYQVAVHNTVVIPNGPSFEEQTMRTFTDTSVTIAGTARTLDNDPVFYGGGSAAVHAVAVDDNYYAYYKLNIDPFAGAQPSRLTGALGVFGSVVPVKRRQYLNVQ